MIAWDLRLWRLWRNFRYLEGQSAHRESHELAPTICHVSCLAERYTIAVVMADETALTSVDSLDINSRHILRYVCLCHGLIPNDQHDKGCWKRMRLETWWLLPRNVILSEDGTSVEALPFGRHILMPVNWSWRIAGLLWNCRRSQDWVDVGVIRKWISSFQLGTTSSNT